MKPSAVSARVRHTLEYLLYAERQYTVRDGDDIYTVGMSDVREIQQACGCSEGEAKQRLADWIVERLEGKE